MGWSLDARYMGTQRPCTGHRETMCWALVAHTMGIECPTFGTVFGHYRGKTTKGLYATMKRWRIDP